MTRRTVLMIGSVICVALVLSCDFGSNPKPSQPTSPALAGMKLIAGGQFQMGQAGIADTVHSVTVSSFYMDSVDVTQEDYLSRSGSNPSHFTGDLKRPVESITWFDAVLYCNSRSIFFGMDTVYSYTGKTISGTTCMSITGLSVGYSRNGFRLPTEAEWEYACRAGTTTTYFWGTDSSPGTVEQYAWYYLNSDSTTHPVAQKKPNALGLYDMVGNVLQYCGDWFNDRPTAYGAAAQVDPTGPTSSIYGYYTVRGGSWRDGFAGAVYLSSAFRDGNYPAVKSNFCGLRCVKR